jgi:hypothetical protein
MKKFLMLTAATLVVAQFSVNSHATMSATYVDPNRTDGWTVTVTNSTGYPLLGTGQSTIATTGNGNVAWGPIYSTNGFASRFEVNNLTRPGFQHGFIATDPPSTFAIAAEPGFKWHVVISPPTGTADPAAGTTASVGLYFYWGQYAFCQSSTTSGAYHMWSLASSSNVKDGAYSLRNYNSTILDPTKFAALQVASDSTGFNPLVNTASPDILMNIMTSANPQLEEPVTTAAYDPVTKTYSGDTPVFYIPNSGAMMAFASGATTGSSPSGTSGVDIVNEVGPVFNFTGTIFLHHV